MIDPIIHNRTPNLYQFVSSGASYSLGSGASYYPEGVAELHCNYCKLSMPAEGIKVYYCSACSLQLAFICGFCIHDHKLGIADALNEHAAQHKRIEI